MNFNEFFGNDPKQQKYGRNDPYELVDSNQFSQSGNQINDIKQLFLNKVRNNSRLKYLLIIAAVTLIIMVAVVIVLLFPLLLKLFKFISENGINGLINTILNGIK